MECFFGVDCRTEGERRERSVRGEWHQELPTTHYPLNNYPLKSHECTEWNVFGVRLDVREGERRSERMAPKNYQSTHSPTNNYSLKKPMNARMECFRGRFSWGCKGIEPSSTQRTGACVRATGRATLGATAGPPHRMLRTADYR